MIVPRPADNHPIGFARTLPFVILDGKDVVTI